MDNKLESFILSNYDCEATSNHGEYRTTCPFCGHQKKKFYFYLTISAFKCYHCEEKGTLKKFFWNLYPQEYKNFDFSNTYDHIQFEIDKKPVKLPNDFKELASCDTEFASKYIDYILKRGISLKTIKHLHLGYSPTKSHYIYIPIRDVYGKQVYYTTILSRRDLPLEKSYNPALGTDFYSKGDVLFNVQNVKIANELWVCEGPFDAMSFIELRMPCVALLGKSMSDRQLELIKLLDLTTVNVCLDGDALPHALNLANKIKPFCKNVKICRLPIDKDPNQLLQEHRLSEVAGHTVPFNSLTKMKILMELKKKA